MSTQAPIQLAITFIEARRRYQARAREYIRARTPMERVTFGPLVLALADAIDNTLHHGRADIERGVERFIYDRVISGAYTIGGDKTQMLPRWEQMASFLAEYVALQGRLHHKCRGMEGVDKGDDSFGDWMDALPLAGPVVTDAILVGDLASYRQIANALQPVRLGALIMDGENYIEMELEDCLIEKFASIAAAAQEDRAEPTPTRLADDSDAMKRAAASLREAEQAATSAREVLSAIRQAALRAEEVVTKTEQAADQAGELARAEWARERLRREGMQG